MRQFIGSVGGIFGGLGRGLAGGRSGIALLPALDTRGRVLALAGLGLCALPVVLLVLIWRDFVLVAGITPLLAIGSATLAALTALAGLELLLRPVTATGRTMQQILDPDQGGVGGPGPAGLNAADAQQLIDELIALRAEHTDPDLTPAQTLDQTLDLTLDLTLAQTGRQALATAFDRAGGPAMAVVLLRVSLPLRHGLQMPPDAAFMSAMLVRAQDHFGASIPMEHLGQGDLGLILPVDATGPAGELTDRIIAATDQLSRPVLQGAAALRPVILSGVALQDPDEAADMVIDHALASLTAATLTMPVVIHGPDTATLAADANLLDQDLRQALPNGEFELFYQPLIDIAAGGPGHAVGAEALIRWHSPRRGFVAPARFIPLAEATGLIDPIGRWVLDQACRQAATWRAGMQVAVNLGARQFLDHDLCQQVSAAIRDAGIEPAQLEIGLTEQVAFIDTDYSRRTLASLHEIGVKVALDDFGTGAADFHSLGLMAFDTLKLDRGFTGDVHQSAEKQAICAAMIALGRGLGAVVVAEGTEQAEEVDCLAALGCTRFQGYYFARPVPAMVLQATFANLGLRQTG